MAQMTIAASYGTSPGEFQHADAGDEHDARHVSWTIDVMAPIGINVARRLDRFFSASRSTDFSRAADWCLRT
jgi:hypothetical protein